MQVWGEVERRGRLHEVTTVAKGDPIARHFPIANYSSNRLSAIGSRRIAVARIVD